MTVHTAHVPMGFLCLNVRKKRQQTVEKEKSTALPWGCGHVHTCCRTATKTSSTTMKIRLCSSGAPPTPTVPRRPLRLCEIALIAVHLDNEITVQEIRLDSHRGNFLLLRCCKSRMVAIDGLFFLLGIGEISGNVILQLLQNTNELAALKCVTAEMAELARSEPQDSWVLRLFDMSITLTFKADAPSATRRLTNACLNFDHCDIHTRRGNINWPPS